MNINRNNYEEYFLLYADKELPAGERSEVEMFVQQNPDLEEEFIMLQQSVLKPDTSIAFEDKNSLLRTEEFIDLKNYEEKFLLYTDNELSAAEIEETEKFVMANPALQQEFALFQKVTFEPDTSITFPGKSSLYKKEDDTKVIPFGWRSMAAAVLLGIGLWLGIGYFKKENIKPETAVKEVPAKENNPVTLDKKDKPAEKPLVNAERESNQAPKTPDIQEKAVQRPPQDVTVKNIQPIPEVKTLEQKQEETVAVVETPEKIEVVQPRDNGLQVHDRTTEPNDKTVPNPTNLQNNMNIIPASYIAEAEEKSENYIFYNITAEDFRKSKIGNFLRKAKRAIAARLPLKNGLKIGNVEIAKDEPN